MQRFEAGILKLVGEQNHPCTAFSITLSAAVVPCLHGWASSWGCYSCSAQAALSPSPGGPAALHTDVPLVPQARQTLCSLQCIVASPLPITRRIPGLRCSKAVLGVMPAEHRACRLQDRARAGCCNPVLLCLLPLPAFLQAPRGSACFSIALLSPVASFCHCEQMLLLAIEPQIPEPTIPLQPGSHC